MMIFSQQAYSDIFRDNTPRIAIISAFDPELLILKENLKDRFEFSTNGVIFATGKLENQDVVLFLSGVSVVNAVMTTQLALNHFAIEKIIFSGIAGGVDPSLNIGDVAIVERWAQYLEMLFAREVNNGWEKVPFFEYPYNNFGMMFPRSVTVLRDGSNWPETRFWFPTDKTLIEAAQRSRDHVNLNHCTSDDHCLSKKPKILIGGSGVSGSAFVDNAIFREWVFETFNAQVLDMESASVAHVAYSNKIPFIAVRSVADLAGGSDGSNQMEIFLKLAADNAASVVKAILREFSHPNGLTVND